MLEQWGTSGPAVLVVHGIGSGRRDAARLGEALAKTHRVFAYDQRGHGSAGSGFGSMRLETLAQDLDEVAAAIADDLHVIGHSWGGAVALLGAAHFAQTLLLIDPLLYVRPGTFQEFVTDLKPLGEIKPGSSRDGAVRSEFAAAHPLDREAKVQALQNFDILDLQRLADENDVEDGGWDLRGQLAEIDVLTRILVAGEDSVIGADDLRQAGPNVEIQYFPGHGHSLHRTAFTEYVEIVRELTLADPA